MMRMQTGSLRSNINFYVGAFFVGSFALLMVTIVLRVALAEDPIADMLLRTIPAEAY